MIRTLVRASRQMVIRSLCNALSRRYTSLPVSLMVVAPHPDDEVLGCGGLIARVLAGGGQVRVIVLTGGEHAHNKCCNIEGDAVKQARRNLTSMAAIQLSLSADRVVFLDWGDGQIAKGEPEDLSRKVEELAAWIGRLRPEAVFAPHPFEGWADHEAAERITRAAIKRSGVACRLFHYCVWFWFSMPLRKAFKIDWHRARILDIRDVYEKKAAAMDAYLKPCAPCGNPWSGLLPKEFIQAFQWKKELFFEADITDGKSPADRVHIGEQVSAS